MKLNSKFKPLYTSDKTIFLITGGRGSAKSFHLSTFLAQLSYEKHHRILYTRYTMASAEISVVPEFNEKIELMDRAGDFTINKTEIINNRTGSDILFRGIKTSSGIQTASLKSIKGTSTWANDESEELVDEVVYDKIRRSIRSNKAKNRIILAMNPTTRQHWIFKRWIEKTHKIVYIDGCPVQISTHPDVCHIHTTYLDNLDNLPKDWLDDVKKLKVENKEKYASEIIGGWLIDLEGTLYKRNEVKRFSMKDFKPETAECKLGYIDVADEGTDSFAFPLAYIFPKKVFVPDVIFTKKNVDFTLPTSIAFIKKHNPNYVRVEANNQGSVFIKWLRNEIEASKILSVTSSTNKHTRIVMAHRFIIEYFHFLNEDEIMPGSDYDRFMKQLFDYMAQKGETKDDDDAPDSLSGLAKFIESYVSHLFK